MDMIGRIRRLHSRGKKSEREISRMTGLSRNTIAKWLKAPLEGEPKYRREAQSGKLTAFHEALKQALKADAHRPKHERRTARALYSEIKASGYEGGYSRVTDFIRHWRQGECQTAAIRAFVPLSFELGEAFQFDWSEEGLVVGGIYYRLQVSHMKLCASRAFWLVAYPSQGHEMLFDAHTRSFAALGGVAIFGGSHISTILSTDVAQYVHIERAQAPRRADIEKSLLSRLFGHGIKLGVCQVNGTIGVEPHGSEPKTAAPPSDELLQAFTDWMAKQSPQTRVVGMAAEFASLAGNRQVEFLALRWEQIDDDAGEIRIVRAKQRGAKKGTVTEVISISEQLADLIARLRHLRRLRDVDCVYVFPTWDNCAYSARGFKTAWSRARAAAIDAGVITKAQRFTFHDLRAFYASKYKRLTKTLPDLHSNPATTARHYDRNKEVERSSL
jgi:integrase/transposase